MPIGKKIRGGTGASPPGSGGGGGKPARQDGPASPAGFRLDAAPGVTAYPQLARQVKHPLRLGYLKPCDQLPGARDLVASPAINPNTALKGIPPARDEGPHPRTARPGHVHQGDAQ